MNPEYDIEDESGSAYEVPSDADQSFPGKSHRSTRSNSRVRRSEIFDTNSNKRQSERSRSPDNIRDYDSVVSSLADGEGDSRIRRLDLTGDNESLSTFRNFRRKKRKAKPASELRAKRLKSYYNDEYRGLVNGEIRNSIARTIKEDETPLDDSQIGSSIWTSTEKHAFFSIISRIGRDNVCEISRYIETKSELEIQEYIHVLQHSLHARFMADGKKQHSITATDHPAAFEISDECYSVLDRAAGALSTRQELYEEQKEESKWGDTWLLTDKICKSIESRRRKEGGEEDIEESLPAVNLLNLGNWLELSHRVFMNPAAPFEDENWQFIAEESETPAVRATAFEDFHSLALNITKRLISTTLFCTASRLRATNAKKLKHADVNSNDVEAAVKILGLKSNSSVFWRECPRRCHLDIVNDDDKSEVGESADTMSYDVVELLLGGTIISRPCSGSGSRSLARPDHPDLSLADGGRLDSEDFADSDPDPDSNSDGAHSYGASLHSEAAGSDSENDEEQRLANLKSRRAESKKKLLEEEKAAKHALEEYIEAVDGAASLREEHRLWALLHQAPPNEIEPEAVDPLDQPKALGDESGELDWRGQMEYWSIWETLPSPIPAEDFVRFRQRNYQQAEDRSHSQTRLGSALSKAVVSDDSVSLSEEESDDMDEIDEDHDVAVQEHQQYVDSQEDAAMIEISDEVIEVNSDQSTIFLDSTANDVDKDIKSEPEE